MSNEERSPLLRADYQRIGDGDAGVRSGDDAPGCAGAGGCFPHRYRLMLLMFIGICLHVSDRSNFSIALVAMTNFTASDSSTNITSQCIPPGPRNSSHHSSTEGEFNWTPSQQSMIMSAYFYGYVILQLPSGYLSERYGGKWISVVAMSMGGLLGALIPVCARWSITALFINRFASGFFTGAAFCGMMAMWGKWAPTQEVSTLVGIVQAGFPVGSVVSFALGGYLADHQEIGGWPLIFYIYGGSMLVWVVLWLIFIYDSPSEDPTISTEERTYIEESTGQRDKVEYQSPPIVGMLKSPQVLTQWFVMMTDMLGYYVIVNSVPVYLQQILGLDLSSNGLFMALSYTACIVPSFIVPRLSDLVRSRALASTAFVRGFNTVMGSGGMGLCVLLLGLIVQCNRALAIALLVLSQFVCGFIFSGYKVVFMEIAPTYVGTLLGLSSVLGNCMGFVTPLFVAGITGNSPDDKLWGYTFTATGAIMMFGSILFAIFVKDQEQEWAKPRLLTRVKQQTTEPIA